MKCPKCGEKMKRLTSKQQDLHNRITTYWCRNEACDAVAVQTKETIIGRKGYEWDDLRGEWVEERPREPGP